VGGERFESFLFYDAGSRVSESRVVYGDVIEGHRRVPIDPSDVDQAAAAAGFEVTDVFSCRTYVRLIPPPVRLFYLLRKRG
jgi:hypothetical protein